MSKRIKIDRIGFDPENNAIFLSGNAKSLLTKKTVYSSIIPGTETELQQLGSIIYNKSNKNNSCIKTFLETAGEEINKLEVAKYKDDVISSLYLSENSLSPVKNVAGLIYALVGESEINADKGLFKTDKKTREYLKYIDFKDIDSLRKIKVLDKISINKEDYNKLEFSNIIESQKMALHPTIPVPIPIGVEKFLVYTTNETNPNNKLKYAFVAPKDTQIINKIAELKNNETELPEINKSIAEVQYDSLEIAEHILKNKGYQSEAVYFDVQPTQPLDESTLVVNPYKVAIFLKKGDKIKILPGSDYYGIGLGFLNDPDLYLNENNLLPQKINVPKNDYTGYA